MKATTLKNNDELAPTSRATDFAEMTLDDVAKVLSLTIKDDDNNKKIVFLAMLSAYTDKSQINVSLNAPSSTGKTYLATEIAKLFPAEDKIERSGASPTSFFYGEGVDDKARKAKIVSLRRKILIFYEQPNPALQEKLRALLSHDSREVVHSLTNKKGGRNQTDTIIIEGFAATVFCSANMVLDEQETTRAILVSPEATEAKIKQAIHLQSMRGSNEDEFDEWLGSRPERVELMERIEAIRDEQVDEIIIENPDEIERRFIEQLASLQPRHQRDMSHLQQIIKAIALVNVWYRRRPDGMIVASKSDIDEAFKLWGDFFESQNLNLPPAVMSIYKKYVLPAYFEKFKQGNEKVKHAMAMEQVGITPNEVSAYYVSQEGSVLNGDHLNKQILPQLERAGVITRKKPQKDNEDELNDRRTRHIIPQHLTDEEKKYIGNGGMEDYDAEQLSQLEELMKDL
ncbi:MAG: hypothetical protein WC549_08115 [Actinomycetota bacterium]